MRTVIQRVSRAAVMVDDETVGRIATGVLVLLGVEHGDGPRDAALTAAKVASMRIFPGETPFDRTLGEVGGACLVVSQFTLLGSLKKGRRPGFDRAAPPSAALPLYLEVVEGLRKLGLPTETGRFGAKMLVELVNDGPATFVLEVRDGEIRSPLCA